MTPAMCFTNTLAIVSTLAIAGCGARDDDFTDERDERAFALNGNVFFPNNNQCTNEQKTKIQEAATLAYQRLNDPRMESCILNAITSRNDEAWPEDTLARMKENKTTNVYCWHLDDGNLAQAPNPSSTELFKVDPDYLNDPNVTTEQRAGLFLHEVAHNKGFSHTDNAVNEYAHSVNQQLFECARKIGMGEANPVPTWKRRDAMWDAQLAPTGYVGGSVFDIPCPSGMIAKGANLRTGDLVDAMGLACGPPAWGIDFDTVMAGGPGGTHSFNDCPAGHVMVGVHGRAGSYQDKIGPYCKPLADVVTGSTSPPTALLAKGGNGGLAFQRLCPPTQAVRGIIGKSGTRVDRLQLECTQIFGNHMIENFIESTGARRPATFVEPESLEKCAGRGVVTLLDLRAGDRIDRLGGKCKEVFTSCASGLCLEYQFGSEHYLPSHGGTGGSGVELRASDTCGPEGVFIGLRVNYNANSVISINGLQGWCAPSTTWTASSGPGGDQLIAQQFGYAGGLLLDLKCPRGQLLTGWRISAGGLVESLAPLCRDFN
jgi:hypothetical protein